MPAARRLRAQTTDQQLEYSTLPTGGWHSRRNTSPPDSEKASLPAVYDLDDAPQTQAIRTVFEEAAQGNTVQDSGDLRLELPRVVSQNPGAATSTACPTAFISTSVLGDVATATALPRHSHLRTTLQLVETWSVDTLDKVVTTEDQVVGKRGEHGDASLASHKAIYRTYYLVL